MSPARADVSGPKTARTDGPYRTAARAVVMAGILAAAVVTLVSFLGRISWAAELFTHFRMQLAAGSLVLTVLAGGLRLPWPALLAAVVTVANFAYLVPYLAPGAGTAAASTTAFKVLSANVNFRNGDYPALRELIRRTRPDIVGLMEVDRGWVESMQPLASAYPYRILYPEKGAYGLALYSRWPLHELDQSPYIEDGQQAAILAELDLGDTATGDVTATLVLAHLMAPVEPAGERLRNRQLQMLATFIREDGNERKLLCGDLNITPWSPFYDVLESDTGIVDAARGIGYRPTWPVHPSVLRIPIDHCLVSGGFEVRSVQTGPDIGSDHLPLIVDIAVTGVPGSVRGSVPESAPL